MKRLKYVDIAKGIAIIMVIIGHSTSGILRGIIFSFHMPLFFILSSYTYTYSTDIKTFKEKIKRNAYHLLIPLIVLFLSKNILELLQSIIVGEQISIFQWIPSLFITLFYSSGVPMTNNNFNIGSIGMLWFIVALFLGRTLYEVFKLYFRKNNVLAIVCSLFSLTGYFLGNICWLPLCMDIVLFIQPYFFIGDLLKDFNYESDANKLLISNGILWGGVLAIMFLLTRNYLQIAPRIYPLYPLCLFGSVFGSLCLVSFCYIISNPKILNKISTIWGFLGKKSMQILFVHYLDIFWKPLWFNNNPYITALLRVLVDLLIFLIVDLISTFFKLRWRTDREQSSKELPL